MRILRIRFKNLNSLAGEWEIDLTHPAYASNGIFAITGPTGAGKSTILDAVCLALYGRTPRLDHVSKSGNEILSRQTGECYAEVTFETQSGRYLCRWGQRRARSKPDGELQQPQQEISNAVTGEILGSKIRDVAERIEAATGMDFDRFTRSMLLAQGGFAAFLQAGPDARAPILEQITGTEIYSRISRQSHVRANEEKARLGLLEAEQAGLHLLGESEADALGAALAVMNAKASAAEVRGKRLAAAMDWRRHLDGLEAAWADIGLLQERLDERLIAFQPDRQRLENAIKAIPLNSDYAVWTTLQQDQTTDEKAALLLREELPLLEKTMIDGQAALVAAETELDKIRRAQQDSLPVLREIRALDLRIREQLAPIRNAETDAAAAGEELDKLRDRLEADRTSRSKLDQERETVHNLLEASDPDTALSEQLAGIRERFSLLADWHRQIVLKAIERTESEAIQARTVEAGRSAAEALEAGRRSLSEARARLDRLVREREIRLGGRPVAEWRSEHGRMDERAKRLETAASLLDARILAERNIDTLGKEHQAGLDGLMHAGHAIRELSLERETLEQRLRFLQTQSSLLQKLQTYEEARNRLEDGQPCPLCGSTEHPYTNGLPHILDDTPAELARAETGLKAKEKAITEALVHKASLEKAVEELSRRLTDAIASAGVSEEALAGILDSLYPGENRILLEKSLQDRRAKLVTDREQVSALLEDCDRLEVETAQARAAWDASNAAAAEAERIWQAGSHESDAAAQAVQRIIREQAMLTGRLDRGLEEERKGLLGYGVSDLSPDRLPDILRELSERRERRAETQRKKAELESRIDALDRQVASALELEARSLGWLTERQAAIARLGGERDSLLRIRQERFGDRDPDAEEKRGTTDREAAELNVAEKRTILEAAGGRYQEGRHRLDALENSMRDRAVRTTAAQSSFHERLLQAGYGSLAVYLSARLPDAERLSLQAAARALDDEQAGLAARKADLGNQLAAERDRRLSDQPISVLHAESYGVEEELSGLRQEIGGIRQRLKDHADVAERNRELMGRIDRQRVECRRWDALHELIGSADGKKFRNFAQGITFEILIGHANRQLRKLSERYLLVRDAALPLELCVVDNDQAGEIRSTKNLSGGESFIVSLSLALGLSQMSSRKVRVDSLFLDEGFGTLDEDTLETALETLAGLRQEGKLIGVISHVPAIRDRLPARIQVVPGPGGKSTLSGPGCRDCSRNGVSV